jgi:beta-galactosidase
MFLSKDAARPGGNFVFNMLQQGYRWAGQGAWHFWVGTDIINNWNSMKPRAVFVREYDWTFGSGQKIDRTFGIFNDTQYAEPITFTRTLMVGNKQVSTKTSSHNIAPGGEFKFSEAFTMPTMSTRTDGQLIVALSVGGKEVFRDVKPLSVLAPVKAAPVVTPASRPAPRRRSLRVETRSNAQVNPALSSIHVYDPQGKIVSYLKASGLAFTSLNSLATLPTSGRVLVVGPDALSLSDSTSSALAAWAAMGRSVIVLDQKHPLRYQALTAEINTVSNDATESVQTNGQVAFPEDLGHPTMRNLRENDLRGWGNDGEVYRNAYLKPARGARSLVQVGPRLEQSALIEIPTGKGLMLLSQLDMGDKLSSSVVAQQLMSNLLSYASTYKQEFRPVALVANGSTQLVKAVDAAGLQYSNASDALSAISDPKIKLALISATPANLKQLAGNMAKVSAFMQRGGYIVWHGLTPEGLEDYNKLVGANHMIRPMRRERVQFSSPRNPLTAGLTLGDVVMLSGERIFGWVSDEYVADDIFSHLVDYDEVAPFGTSQSDLYNNAVNGFVGSDGWKQINDFPVPKTGPATLAFTLSKPQTITEFVWDASVNYNATTKVGLVVDGKMQSWNVPANGDAQTLKLNPPLTGSKIELQIQNWEKRADKRNAEGDYIVGIDNIWLKTQRPAEYYQKVKPVLNVGGMMHYPRGDGGMVLMNILFKDTEAVPINVQKKRTIFATVLRNLNAPFAGGKTIIAGAGLNYTPVNFGSFQNKLTQFRTDRGWFGDANRTFNALPRGDQNFAGVKYNIWDFPTSPVPTSIMLGSDGVPNNPPQEVKDIPINLKTDALFFLHTARIDQRRNNDEQRDNKKFEMARYIINYADGQSVTVPIYSEIDIENYRQENPRAVPGAQLAWTSKYEGSNESAVAYSKQWNNPRPDVTIKSIDFTYGNDRRGVPVLLAITAATAAK